MKYAFSFFLLLALGTGHPKSINPINNSDAYTSKLKVAVKGSNADGSISKGGYVVLEIDGEDAKGIASFRIRIPSFYIHQEIKSVGKKKRWKIHQTFTVDAIDGEATPEIYLTLKNTDGNVLTKIYPLTIQE
ncbi:MAG: hypothetical protein AAGL34_07275 [Bacteroidota bacterium]